MRLCLINMKLLFIYIFLNYGYRLYLNVQFSASNRGKEMSRWNTFWAAKLNAF